MTLADYTRFACQAAFLEHGVSYAVTAHWTKDALRADFEAGVPYLEAVQARVREMDKSVNGLFVERLRVPEALR